jgi:vesicle-fusing ATPase
VTVSGIELVDVGSTKSTSKRGILLAKTAINFTKASDSTIKLSGSQSAAPTSIIKPNFNFADLGIGGLDEEFSNIFRRAFVSRIFPPSVVEKMGIQHVKGLILYGKVIFNMFRTTWYGKNLNGSSNW